MKRISLIMPAIAAIFAASCMLWKADRLGEGYNNEQPPDIEPLKIEVRKEEVSRWADDSGIVNEDESRPGQHSRKSTISAFNFALIPPPPPPKKRHRDSGIPASAKHAGYKPNDLTRG